MTSTKTTTITTTRNFNRTNKSNRRTGAVMIYMAVAMTAFAGIVSLAVDWGQTQLAKTELQAAADAAARAGAAGLTVRNGDWTAQRLAYGESMNDTFAVAHTKTVAFANHSGGN